MRQTEGGTFYHSFTGLFVGFSSSGVTKLKGSQVLVPGGVPHLGAFPRKRNSFWLQSSGSGERTCPSTVEGKKPVGGGGGGGEDKVGVSCAAFGGVSGERLRRNASGELLKR